MAELVILRNLWAEILRLIDRLRPAPLPPCRAAIEKHPGLPTKELRLTVSRCGLPSRNWPSTGRSVAKSANKPNKLPHVARPKTEFAINRRICYRFPPAGSAVREILVEKMVSEKFLERVRSAHFFLMAASFALLTTLFLDQRRDVDMALDQLQNVRDISDKLSRDQLIKWLEEAAESIVSGVTDELGPSQVLVRNGSNWFLLATIDFNRRYFINDQFEEIDEFKIEKLSEFRRVWNGLKRVRIDIVKGVNTDSLDINDNSFYLNTVGSGARTFGFKSPVRKSDFRITAKLEELDDARRSLPERHEIRARFHFALQGPLLELDINSLQGTRYTSGQSEDHPLLALKESYLHALRNAVRIRPLMEAQFTDATTIIRRSLDPSLPNESFDLSFRELSSLTRRKRELKFADLEAELVDEAEKTKAQIEILGSKIPASGIPFWGAPLILAMQLYFYLHLSAITRRLDDGLALPDFAWIGVYGGWLSQATTFLTAVIFPVVVGFYILWRGEAGSDMGIRSFVILGSCLLGLIAAAIAVKLTRFWQAREAVASQDK